MSAQGLAQTPFSGSSNEKARILRPIPQGENPLESDEDAIVLALQALAFVAGDADLLARFLDLTGLSPDRLRSEAETPAILAAVLDFLLGHEPDLERFCRAADCAPQAPAAARARLAGPPPMDEL